MPHLISYHIITAIFYAGMFTRKGVLVCCVSHRSSMLCGSSAAAEWMPAPDAVSAVVTAVCVHILQRSSIVASILSLFGWVFKKDLH